MGILPLDPHRQLSDHIASPTALGAAHSHGASVSSPPPETDPSPVSRLPPELLAEIFICCLPEGQFPAPCVTAAPLLPAHICKAWRSVALSTPQLWSAIHLHHRDPLQDVRLVHLWLTHSGNQPLSLSLSIDFDERPQQAILNLICRYSQRWEHVRFKFRQLLCPPMYDLELAMGNVPMLSTFEFHARDVSAGNILPIRRLLSSAPHLKEISWVDDLADAETLLALPLSRLARLSLSIHYGSLDYIELLDQCANLEHIRITRPGPDIRPTPRAPPVLLPKLTSLNIAHDLTGILEHLILPALKHVRVQLDADSSGDTRYSRLMSVPTAGDMIAAAGSPLILPAGDAALGHTWDPKGLIQLIERSSCHLESLTIHVQMQHDDLLACLKACSLSLKRLGICGRLTPASCSALSEMLSPRRLESSSSLVPSLVNGGVEDDDEEWESLCPRLTELIIDTRIPNTCSLVDMLQARMDLALSDDASTPTPTIPLQQPEGSSSPYFDEPLPIGSSTNVTLLPFERLRLHYPVGHRDIPILRDLAFSTNSKKRDSLDLKIVESRLGNARGSSAGSRSRVRPYANRRRSTVVENAA